MPTTDAAVVVLDLRVSLIVAKLRASALTPVRRSTWTLKSSKDTIPSDGSNDMADSALRNPEVPVHLTMKLMYVNVP